MSEWEDLLEKEEYTPVYDALHAGIALLEKYYCRADDTDVYYIAHGMWHSVAEALSWYFSILVNKICKIMKKLTAFRAAQISQDLLLIFLSVGRRPSSS